jgi:hypothetical protein
MSTDTMLFVSLFNSNALTKDGGKGYQPTDNAFWKMLLPTAFTTSAVQDSPFKNIDGSSVLGPTLQSAAAKTMMNQALDPLQIDYTPYHSDMDKIPIHVRRSKAEKNMVAKNRKDILRFRESRLPRSIPNNKQFLAKNACLASSSPMTKGIYAYKNSM